MTNLRNLEASSLFLASVQTESKSKKKKTKTNVISLPFVFFKHEECRWKFSTEFQFNVFDQYRSLDLHKPTQFNLMICTVATLSLSFLWYTTQFSFVHKVVQQRQVILGAYKVERIQHGVIFANFNNFWPSPCVFGKTTKLGKNSVQRFQLLKKRPRLSSAKFPLRFFFKEFFLSLGLSSLQSFLDNWLERSSSHKTGKSF